MIGGFIKPIGDVVNIDRSSIYEDVIKPVTFTARETDYMRRDIFESRQALKRLRKECKFCGCIMSASHDGDVCECCKDDREEDQD